MLIPKWLVVLLGVASIWPALYVAIYIAFFVTLVFGTSLNDSDPRSNAIFASIFIAHFLTMLMTVGLLTFYIVHVFRNDELASDKRVLWAIVLFMGNVVAFPVYWYHHVWTPRAPGHAA